jgi:hypothetical protein
LANYNSSHTGAEIDSAIGRVKDTAVTAGTVTASKGVVVDANKDISGFRNVTLTGQLQAATINLTGDTTIGDGDSDNITINADVNSNIIPNTDNTFDLGSASKQWKDLYVNGIGYIDQLGTDADPIAIYASSGEIDGTAIGSESASTGAFTTINASGNITGNLVGNVTGNVSGTAATVTGAAQSAITSVGTLTTLTVDDMTLNGSTISDAGAFDIDAGGVIKLDAGGGQIQFFDDGTEIGVFENSSSNFVIESKVQDKDILFKGNDGGSGITALTLDMSEGGNATFSGNVTIGDKILYTASDYLKFAISGTDRLWISDATDNWGLNYTGNSPYGMQITTASDSNSTDAFVMKRTYGGSLHKVFEIFNNGVIKTYGDSSSLNFHNTAGTLRAFLQLSSTGLIIDTDSFIEFKPNNSTAMYIDSSQRVGIGTTSPAYKLDLASSEAIVSQFTGSSGETILSLDNTSTNGDKWYLISGGSGGSFAGGKFGIFNADTTTAVATFTNDGKVGIGTSSPARILDLNGASNTDGIRFNNSGYSYYNEICNNGDGLIFRVDPGTTGGSGVDFRWTINDVEQMRLVQNGQLNGGDNSGLSASQDLSAQGNKLFWSLGGAFGSIGLALNCGAYTSSYDLQRFYNGNGQVGAITTSGSGTSFTTSSDYRLKENEVVISDGLTRLNQLKPYRFNFKADKDTTVDGFFAHEVSDIVPEAIIGEKDAVDDDGNIVSQSIDQSKLVPLLVKAVQELTAKVEALENA